MFRERTLPQLKELRTVREYYHDELLTTGDRPMFGPLGSSMMPWSPLWNQKEMERQEQEDTNRETLQYGT